ncbi:hypothetical protein T12_12982 [Trichinella patagoniensis]|uniref:Uncharacterized protein n=1 Tax=Trichinella patagoniensis TaxID=990121 RepID=A0A0V0Z943_9BILA|nr:hypothetical protein T12_12982 [Trichinella patagoniensis]
MAFRDKALEVQLQSEIKRPLIRSRSPNSSRWLTEKHERGFGPCHPLSDCSARSNDLDHRSNSKASVKENLPELKMPVLSGVVAEGACRRDQLAQSTGPFPKCYVCVFTCMASRAVHLEHGPTDDDGQSDTSAPAIHRPVRKTGDYPIG